MKDQNRRTDRLAQALAARIFNGDWPEGHKLPADEALCAEYGVSRTVVREAFRLLRGKGLLSARPRVGTLVAARAKWSIFEAETLHWLSESGVLADLRPDMQDIRFALEPSFAALAAARADAHANQSIQTALRELQNSPDEAHEMAFLSAFYTASGNRFADAALALTQHAVRLRETDMPLAAYARLTAAIAQKNGVEARQAALQALIETAGQA